MQNISGMNCPIDPRGNPKFIKNIYNSIEKEYETKKRFCKWYSFLNTNFNFK